MSREEDEVTEDKSFMLDQELDRLELTNCESIGESDLRIVDPETHARLELLLDAAGIGKLSTADGKALTDPEVLHKLTSSVSCALDEAAAALTRMRAEQQQAQMGGSGDSGLGRSLVEACSDGDINTVRNMLEKGGNVHETTDEGDSLLSLACSAGYFELAQVLLAMNANVEDRGVKGDCTPLMEAASGGYLDIVQLLIVHEADVNAQSSAGNTPLHYAAAGGFVDIVNFLLMSNANVEEHNENGHTPLMEAASAGHVPVAQALLDAGAGINTHSNEFKESALTLACYKGHLEMVKFLLDAGADHEHKTDEMHTALMEASMDGHVNVARLLLDSGAQVNMPPDSFESPLTLAACGGHADLATLLIERGANLEEVNDEGYTPLMEAAREGHDEMVHILLAHGAEINAQTEETQETALTLACCGGFLEVAELLIKVGGDVELGCSTPLMEASQEGHFDLVKYLIHKAGAKVNATTPTGDTALTYACENGHTDVAEVLLDAGAVLDHESEGGRTPLMKAARAGHYSTVQFLIARGSEVNKTTATNDHTVLSLACAGGHKSVVELLLCQGANIAHKLKDGSTMIIEASKGGHYQVVNLLLNWPNCMHASPDAANVPLPDSQCNEQQRVPFSGLANYVPPMEPDSSTNYDMYLNQHTAKPNAMTRKEKTTKAVKNCNVNNQTTMPLGTVPPKKLVPPLRTVPQTSSVQKPNSSSMLPPSSSDNLDVQGVSSQMIPKDGTGPITDDVRASERLDTIFSSMVKDLILNMNGTPEEQMNQHLLVMEELQKVEKELKEKGAVQGNKLNKGSDELHLQALELQLQYMNMQLNTENASREDDCEPDYLSHEYLQRLLQLSRFARTAGITNDKKGGLASANLDELELLVRAKMQEQGFNVSPEAVPSLSNNSGDFNPEAYLITENLLDQNYSVPIDNVVDSTLMMPDEDMNLLSEISENFTGLPLPLIPPDHAPCQASSLLAADLSAQSACALGTEISDASIDQATLQNATHPSSLSQTNLVPYTPTIADMLAVPLDGYAESDDTLNLTSEQVMLMQKEQALIQKQKLKFQEWVQQLPYGAITYLSRYLSEKKNLQELQNVARNVGTAQRTDALDIETITSPSSSMPPTPNPSPASPQNWYNSAVDLNAQTESNHDTALTLACAGGHTDLVTLLLTKSADIEHRDRKGFTPLILAATAGHVEVVEILLDQGADIEAQSERTKDTPLSLACSGGRFEVVELLLARGANKEHRNVSDYTPLSLAASGGYVSIIKHLLTHGAEINSRTGSKLGISPLMLAAMNGHTAAVKLLLDMGSDINAQIETNRNTALTLACFQGRHEVVSLLVDRKAMLEHRAKTGLTPLMEAASGGYVDVGRVLLDKGADVNASPVPSSRDTALTIAADKGHYRFVELLLSRGASVDVKNKKGDSPLWLASNGGHLEVVQLLVIAKANIDSQDNRKVSCLMAAFRKGHTNLIKWMVKHVTQFPSDQECSRYIQTITEPELQQKCQHCMETIEAAKAQQAAEAYKNATNLLEELDLEKKTEEKKRAAQERKRQKRKKKRMERQKGKGNDEIVKADSLEPDEEDDDIEDEKTNENDSDPPLNIEPPSATTISTLGTSLTYTSVEARNKRNRGSTIVTKANQKSHDLITTAIKTSVLTSLSNTISLMTTTVTSSSSTTKLATSVQTDIARTTGTRNRKDKHKDHAPPTRTSMVPVSSVVSHASGRKADSSRTSGVVSSNYQSMAKMNGDIITPSNKKKKDLITNMRSTKITDLDEFGTIPVSGRLSEREFAKITKKSENKHSYSSHGHSQGYRNDHSTMTNGPIHSGNTKSPHSSSKRQGQRKEDGWKEVVRKCKRVNVPSTAISRVIGRGGCNINTIRDTSGAHIEVEKQRGTSDRLVTIRGSVESTRQAHMLIMGLVNEPDRELTDIVPEVLSMSASHALMNGPSSLGPSNQSYVNVVSNKSVSAPKTSTMKALQFTSIGVFTAPTNSASASRIEKTTAPPILVWNNAQAQQSSVTVAVSPKKVLMKAAAAQQSFAGQNSRPLSGGSFDQHGKLSQNSLNTHTVVTFTPGSNVQTSPPVNINDASRMADRTGSKHQQRSASAPIGVTGQPAMPRTKSEFAQPMYMSNSETENGNLLAHGRQFSPFNLFSGTAEQVLGKKDEKCKNFASIVAGSGTVSSNSLPIQLLPGHPNENLVTMSKDVLGENLDADLIHRAKAPGFKPPNLFASVSHSTQSPTSINEAGGSVYHQLQAVQSAGLDQAMTSYTQQLAAQQQVNSTMVPLIYSQMMPQYSLMMAQPSAALAQQMNQPPINSQMASQVPLMSHVIPHGVSENREMHDLSTPQQSYRDSTHIGNPANLLSGSRSAGTSPRNQSADHVYAANIHDNQKEEYQTPNRPMTLPKIGSGLNPNAPDFSLRMGNMPSLNSQPSPSHTPPTQSYSDPALFSLTTQVHNLQQQYHINQTVQNMAALQQELNVKANLPQQLQHKLALQALQQVPRYTALDHQHQVNPTNLITDADMVGINGPLSGMQLQSGPLDNYNVLLDDRKMVQPIGSGRSQRKLLPTSSNVGLFTFGSEIAEWPSPMPISSVAPGPTTIIMTSVVMTSTVMTPNIASQPTTDITHPASGLNNSGIGVPVSYTDLIAIDQQFQNPVMVMPQMYNASPQYNPELAMYEGPDMSMWSNSMKGPPIADPTSQGWNKWSPQGNM